MAKITNEDKKNYYELIVESLQEARDKYYLWYKSDASPETTASPSKMREFSDIEFNQKLSEILRGIRTTVRECLPVQSPAAGSKEAAAEAYLNEFVAWHAIQQQTVFDWKKLKELDFPENNSLEGLFLQPIQGLLIDIYAGTSAYIPMPAKPKRPSLGQEGGGDKLLKFTPRSKPKKPNEP